MTFLRNLGLFFVVFLSLVALVSMVMEGVLGDRVATSPEWRVGWNPIMWLIVTSPWLIPTVLVVPVLHFLARGLRKRMPLGNVRRIMLVASPVLFLVAVLALWGPSNLQLDFALPVVLSGLAYGALFRIPAV